MKLYQLLFIVSLLLIVQNLKAQQSTTYHRFSTGLNSQNSGISSIGLNLPKLKNTESIYHIIKASPSTNFVQNYHKSPNANASLSNNLLNNGTIRLCAMPQINPLTRQLEYPKEPEFILFKKSW